MKTVGIVIVLCGLFLGVNRAMACTTIQVGTDPLTYAPIFGCAEDGGQGYAPYYTPVASEASWQLYYGANGQSIVPLEWNHHVGALGDAWAFVNFSFLGENYYIYCTATVIEDSAGNTIVGNLQCEIHSGSMR